MLKIAPLSMRPIETKIFFLAPSKNFFKKILLMEEVPVVQGSDWTTHSLSEVGHCWAKLRLRKEGLRVLRDKTDLMTLLNHWWDHGGEPEKKGKIPNAPSDCVAFADSGFEQNDALCDPDAGIPVAMRDLVNDQGIDFDYSPIVCFYALIPGKKHVTFR